jgi:hypothetical protein
MQYLFIHVFRPHYLFHPDAWTKVLPHPFLKARTMALIQAHNCEDNNSITCQHHRHPTVYNPLLHRYDPFLHYQQCDRDDYGRKADVPLIEICELDKLDTLECYPECDRIVLHDGIQQFDKTILYQPLGDNWQ